MLISDNEIEIIQRSNG